MLRVDPVAAPGARSRQLAAFRWLCAMGVTGWMLCLARLVPSWVWPVGLIAAVVGAAASVAWVADRVSGTTMLSVVTGGVALIGLACAAQVDALNGGLALSGATGIVCLLVWIVSLVPNRTGDRSSARRVSTWIVPVIAVGGLALIPAAFDLRVRAAGDDLDVLAASVLLHVGADGEPTDEGFSSPVVAGTFTIESVYFLPSRTSARGREVRFVTTDEGWVDLVYVESQPGMPGHWGRDKRQW